jgi:hypothetical protein
MRTPPLHDAAIQIQDVGGGHDRLTGRGRSEGGRGRGQEREKKGQRRRNRRGIRLPSK